MDVAVYGADHPNRLPKKLPLKVWTLCGNMIHKSLSVHGLVLGWLPYGLLIRTYEAVLG